MYADTDARIRKLESGAPLASLDEDADVSGLAVNADAEIYKAYKHAYNLSQENKHKEAYEAFNVFITQYPDSKYTPDALYGLGYSQFALKIIKLQWQVNKSCYRFILIVQKRLMQCTVLPTVRYS